MKRLKSIIASRHFGLLAALALVVVGFGLASENFRDPLNLLDRSRHWVEIGLIAVPMTFIIAAGGIDLSVGSLLAMCAIAAGICFRDLHWPLAMALAVGALAGAAGGAFNGLLVSRLRIPALVATLATMALFRGLAMGLSQASPIREFPDGFTDWGSTAALNVGGYAIPQQTLILLAAVVVGDFLFRKTRAGRWAVQIGENETAARFAAIPVGQVRFGLFLASGLVCGLASIINTARFATAHPAAGTGLELEVIAAVVIGGTRITGGGGSVLGTLLGLLILGLLRFGMDMTGILQQHQIILIGLLVVITAIFNEWMARRRERRVRPAATATLGGGVS